MAESKYLKFQDLDRDGLIDVCDDIIEAEEVPCKAPCIPNPLEIVSDWKERGVVPRLNKKFCLFEVTFVTPHKTTASQIILDEGSEDKIAHALRLRFEEFKMEAVESLLEFQDKLINDDTRKIVADEIQFTKWDIDPRPNSRLKLLYSVRFDVLFNLPEAPPEPEEEEEDEPGRIAVTYSAGQMRSQMIRVRKGLNFYGRLLKVYRAIGEGNAYYLKDRTIFNLDMYGDSTIFDSGMLSDLFDNLDGFLDSKGFRLPGEFFGMFSADSLVTKLKFVFKNYKLVKLKVWTVACANKPTVFGPRRLKSLNASGAWKDRTNVAYFAQLPQMYTGLNARQQIPWTEFIEQYTYPKVFFDIKEENTERSIASCVGEALDNEFKDLGQDILDDVFSMGDAVAYMFRQAVCRGDISDSIKDDELMGAALGPDGVDPTKVFAMAQEQRYKKLESSQNTFVILCVAVLSSSTQWGPLKSKLSDMFQLGIFRIKECGLLDMLMSAIQCLTSGMTMDEMLSQMVSAALKAMSIENFGELFVGLPPEKQEELEAMVKKQLEEGEFFQSVGVIARPWEAQEIIDKERAETIEGAYESQVTPNTSGAYQSSGGFVEERSVMSSFDAGIGELEEIPVDNIMQAYLKAIVMVYSDNLLSLVDELNKFPGAQIVSSILTFLDCPHPPFMTPSIADFIKDLTLPFCRNMNEFRTTRWMFENPLNYFADFADITRQLWVLAKLVIMEIIAIILFNIMIKLCEIIGKALCKALEITGDVIAALPAAMSGRTTLAAVIKESICGEDADDEKVNDTVIDLMSQLGLGAAAYADQETTLQFGMDLSAAVTQQEMIEALLGNPPKAFLEAADQLIEYEYPQFRESMPNKRSIGKFFGNVGNLTPLSYRAQLEDFIALDPGDDDEVLPANPSICANPQKIEEFRKMRAQLLEGRTSPKQAHDLFCNFREENMQDLGDLANVLNKGFTSQFADQFPPLFSEPGCDDGLIPYESPQAAAVVMGAMGGSLDSLEMAYLEDMLGNGSFWNSDSSWGFINMIMSDTQGNPLTAHHRKAFNNKSYVNFATNLKNGGESTSGFFSSFQSSAGFSAQEGQFPYYIGEWLMRQFLNAGWEAGGDGSRTNKIIKPGNFKLEHMGEDLRRSMVDKGGFISNNSAKGKKKHWVDFEKLQYNNLFGSMTQGVNLFMIPDFGYNTTVSVDESIEKVVITREIRKGGANTGEDSQAWKRDGADISLDFRDNAAGSRLGPIGTDGKWASSNNGTGRDTSAFSTSTEWSYGFDVKCYYHDIYENDDGRVLNRFDDNMRVEVIEKLNFGSKHIGPLGSALEDDFTKVPMFDLPNGIENIPIVGWALEGLINLILFPFSQLIGRAIARAKLRGSERIIRAREFEFVATDDALDVFNQVQDPVESKLNPLPKLSDFPKFKTVLRSLPSVSPPVLMLSDLTGLTTAESKQRYDATMNYLYQNFCYEIGSNKNGFLYGANYDFLTNSDIDYGMIDNGKFIPYDGYMVQDVDGFDRAPKEEDMILGVSRDFYNNGADARVIYLDPKTFGGSYTKPPLYIRPNKHNGWYGYVKVLFPEYTPCKPHRQDLIDFDEIKGYIDKFYPQLAEDPRLTSGSEECTREVPFKRILNRQAKIGLYTTILAGIRIYASTHIFKAIPTFSKIMPKFPDNFSSIYSAYIVERMEEDFKDAQGAFWEAFTTFKDEEFWYAFLEQAVECYDFLVNAGAMDPPTEGGHLQDAFDNINNLQTDYPFTYRPTSTRRYRRSDGENVKQTVLGMHDKKVTGEAGWFQSLEGIRADQNLEAVQSVEEYAKIILQQLVNFELSKMGEKMVNNMRLQGFNPDIFDLDYYIFEKLCVSSNLRFAGPSIIEVPAGLPTPTNPDPNNQGDTFPGPYYTSGGEFRVAVNNNESDGFNYADEFVGYYHAHYDEVGDIIYMIGEYHSEDPENGSHDILTPIDQLVSVNTQGYIEHRQDEDKIAGYAGGDDDGPTDDDDSDPTSGDGRQSSPDSGASPYDKIELINVPIGDVPSLGTIPAGGGDMTQPYGIEKYISINGQKYSPSSAVSKIKSNDSQLRLSDVYPGTMEQIFDAGNNVIGIKGQMGVRYGLNFYYMDGMKKLITSVEVDALDLKINQFREMKANSKLLFCLVNHLKEDPKYKLLTNYVFSIKKVTGTLAIYNDMALLSSIGEVTPGSGDQFSWLPTSEFFAAWPLGSFIANPMKRKDWMSSTNFDQVRVKPGSRAYVYKKERDYSFESYTPPSLFNPFGSDDPIEGTIVTFNKKKSGVTGNEGWASYDERQPGFFGGLWVCEWDNWDRILLRNSKSRLKRMFKSYYYSRDFKPGDSLIGDEDSPVKALAKDLKARMFPNPARGMLPWWQRGLLRSNPYNAKGGLCDGKD